MPPVKSEPSSLRKSVAAIGGRGGTVVAGEEEEVNMVEDAVGTTMRDPYVSFVICEAMVGECPFRTPAGEFYPDGILDWLRYPLDSQREFRLTTRCKQIREMSPTVRETYFAKYRGQPVRGKRWESPGGGVSEGEEKKVRVDK